MDKIIHENDSKIKNITKDYETKIEQMKQALDTSQELVTVKDMEIDTYIKKCGILEKEIEDLRKNRHFVGDNEISKILVLEKNLENMFQKLVSHFCVSMPYCCDFNHFQTVNSIVTFLKHILT